MTSSSIFHPSPKKYWRTLWTDKNIYMYLCNVELQQKLSTEKGRTKRHKQETWWDRPILSYSNDFFYKESKKAIIVYSELSNKHAANGYNGYKKLCMLSGQVSNFAGVVHIYDP